MNRVMIITYYWPPSGGGGVQRWLKFARYLGEQGWTPVVVAPEGAAYPVTDASLSDDIPAEVEVLRVPIWEPFAAGQKVLGKEATKVERLGASAKQDAGSGLTGWFARWVRGNVFIPDSRVGWVRPATRAILKHLANQPVDAIITTGPPHSVHLIGLRLKRATGLPWVADFRDPWSDIDYLDDFHLTRWARRAHQRLERTVVETADRMLVTARGAARGVEANPARVWWIPNGWDESDFHSPARPSDAGAFVLAHFGSLYASRNFTAVWEAVATWNAVASNRRILLQFYGNTAPEVVASLAEHLTPGRDFVVHGNLPHRQAVDEMHRANALLIMHNNTNSGSRCIPGKLFEYLATGRPVLAVGPVPGDMAALIADELQPAGCPWWVHSPAEAEKIADTMGELVAASDHAQGPLPIAEAFERRALAGGLALKLTELIAPIQGNLPPETRVNN